jgi:hypothetical protein
MRCKRSPQPDRDRRGRVGLRPMLGIRAPAADPIRVQGTQALRRHAHWTTKPPIQKYNISWLGTPNCSGAKPYVQETSDHRRYRLNKLLLPGLPGIGFQLAL